MASRAHQRYSTDRRPALGGRTRTRHSNLPLALALLALAAGCSAPTDDGRDSWDSPCRQTGEFGNYGCARVVAIAEFADGDWPSATYAVVSAEAATWVAAGDGFVGPMVGDSVVFLRLIRWMPATSPDSTAGVVRAVAFEQAARSSLGVSLLPPLARDSATFTVRWAAIGEVAPVDTVRVVLRRRDL